MRKFNLLLAAALVVGMSAPALAEDNGAASPDVSTMAKSAVWFPVQVAGVTAAWVVGTPIACTRRTAVRIHDYTSEAADKIGGHEHFPPVLFASVFGVPAGTMVGVSEGVYHGAKNAIAQGVEHPFCLDSFSLGDNVEE